MSREYANVYTSVLECRSNPSSHSRVGERLVRFRVTRDLLAPRVFRTATAPGSEALFPLEVLHLARRCLGSAPTSKGLFSRCVENVSGNEPFVGIGSNMDWTIGPLDYFFRT